ncbi:MAG TPA: hypothetical protein VMM92_04505 [Thermoanaerobaculia bacterium]|nr:hypothetical protein [Thermoanaerobaculia bacterium]
MSSPSPLDAWENFYVIVGSSAAALIGLQFVVIALIAESRVKSSHREIAAFGTPTILHFCTVLFLGAVLSAPWQRLSYPSMVLEACGAAGVVYILAVIRRTRRQTGYIPVLEDWLWHVLFPLVAYSALLAAATVLERDPRPALFVIATSALILLYTGIHNSWDTVTYIVVERKPLQDRSTDRAE